MESSIKSDPNRVFRVFSMSACARLFTASLRPAAGKQNLCVLTGSWKGRCWVPLKTGNRHTELSLLFSTHSQEPQKVGSSHGLLATASREPKKKEIDSD